MTLYQSEFRDTPAQTRERQQWISDRCSVPLPDAIAIDRAFRGDMESLAMAATYIRFAGSDVPLELVLQHVRFQHARKFSEALLSGNTAGAIASADFPDTSEILSTLNSLCRSVLRLNRVYPATQRFAKVNREALIATREKQEWLTDNWTVAAQYDYGQTARRLDLLAYTAVEAARNHRTPGLLTSLALRW